MKSFKDDFKNTMILINPHRNPSLVQKFRKKISVYKNPLIRVSKNMEDFLQGVRDFYYHDELNYLLIWGGDGTVHAGVNSIVKEKNKQEHKNIKAIGFFRGGSGNGIQESYEVPFKLSSQIKAFARSIKKNYTIDIDLIQININGEEYYSQLAGIGMDAVILDKRNRQRFRWGRYKGQVKPGFFGYFFAFIDTFFNHTPFKAKYKIQLNNGKYILFGHRVNAQYSFKNLERKVKTPLIEVGSRPYYGNMLKICPYVVCNDGFIDIYLYRFKSKYSILLNLPDIYLGRYHRVNKRYVNKKKGIIEHYKVKSLKISASSPFLMHIDGELFETKNNNGNHEVTMKVRPEELTFLVPPEFYHKFHPF